MTFGCNLGLVLPQIELQINEIEASYITIHKVYFKFWESFKFGGPVRPHNPHGPKAAPDDHIEMMLVIALTCTNISHHISFGKYEYKIRGSNRKHWLHDRKR